MLVYVVEKFLLLFVLMRDFYFYLWETTDFQILIKIKDPNFKIAKTVSIFMYLWTYLSQFLNYSPSILRLSFSIWDKQLHKTELLLIVKNKICKIKFYLWMTFSVSEIYSSERGRELNGGDSNYFNWERNNLK